MSDEKYIERLKTDIHNLQRVNAKLLDELAEARGHLKSCDTACQNLTSENNSAKSLIWAILHSSGGRCDIKDSSMAMSRDAANVIKTMYDAARNVTIMKAEAKLQE